MYIAPATADDIASICKLVNAAYRGEESKKGWTTEAWMIDGDKRTHEQDLARLLGQDGAVILLAKGDAHNLLGSVYLHSRADGLYLGLLSVWPTGQTRGVGKYLMQAAEDYARQRGIRRIYMNVISIRQELIAWYKRRGYNETAERKPFPDHEEFGMSNRPLEFVVMEKILF